jgi:hypothetical protein
MSRHGDVIIEFYQVGAYIKVTAVDTVTYTEVSIVGDPTRSEQALKRAAIRKLEYVLERDHKAGGAPRGGRS